MSNEELNKILIELAVMYEIQGIPFKPRAFERAAYAIESADPDLAKIYKEEGIKGLENIPGVGQGIAERIEEYLKNGHIKEYDKFKKKFPVDITGLMKIAGMGPKHIEQLYKKLKVKNVADLKKAIAEGKIQKIPRMGKKFEEKVSKELGAFEESSQRHLLGEVIPLVRKMISKIKELSVVDKIECAGSVRRMQETIGDIDILITSDDPEKVMDYFVKIPEVKEILAEGTTKTTVRLRNGMNADLRVVAPESFGAALQYFTGDKYHNVVLREIAIKKGYTLNEYGLFHVSEGGWKSKKAIVSKTEEEIYEKLGMAWMPPEIRTNHGEIEAAIAEKLPKLVELADIKGDLQVQTDWTDGEHSIKEMAEAAKKRGLKYIAITDHTKSLAMTGGSDEKKLERQIKKIDKIQKEVSGIKILKGAEVNILKDGTLDIDDKTLAKLDVVGAAVHSNFNMEEKDMTARIVRAMENPHVDILFHPTGRLINRRQPYKVNIDAIIKTAKKTKTVLEIDAYPDRLDLKDEYIRKAVEARVKLSIDTDAHAVWHFQFMEYGVAQARRGWAEKGDIINTRDWQEMLKCLK